MRERETERDWERGKERVIEIMSVFEKEKDNVRSKESVFVCLCACVCVRERERERKRESKRVYKVQYLGRFGRFSLKKEEMLVHRRHFVVKTIRLVMSTRIINRDRTWFFVSIFGFDHLRVVHSRSNFVLPSSIHRLDTL